MTTTIIDNLNTVLATLKSEIESVLSTYTVKLFMQNPKRVDRYPMCIIVPEITNPAYLAISQEEEYGLHSIQVFIVVRTPFDLDGSTMFTDLSTLITKLKAIRHDTTKWRNLSYEEGIKFGFNAASDNAMLQSAQISLKIKK